MLVSITALVRILGSDIGKPHSPLPFFRRVLDIGITHRMCHLSRQTAKSILEKSNAFNAASSLQAVGCTKYVNIVSCSGMPLNYQLFAAELQFDANVHFRQLVRLRHHVSLLSEVVSHGGHVAMGTVDLPLVSFRHR
jgi:hypothetical protein